jgi:serine/threonine protein kinase
MNIDLRSGSEPIYGYSLIERLGRGGFGEVWKASGPGGIRVALKFVALDQNVGKVELRALEVIKDIRHPHLLSMSGSWQVEGMLIIAMELAERTLMDRFRDAVGQGFPGIPAPEIFEHFLDASKGLDYLNEPRHPTGDKKGPQGIQHRDIKPQNLLLIGGSVKVADFGLARMLEHSTTGHTGSMTPSYAAPEFFENKTSSQSDQYSLAVTYCQLRGGRLPFEGNPAAVISGHLYREPDLSMLSEAERPAVARALAKSSRDRWPSCREFVKAVTLASEQGFAPRPSDHPNPGYPLALTVPITRAPGSEVVRTPEVNPDASLPKRNRRSLAAVTVVLCLAASVSVGSLLWRSGTFLPGRSGETGPLAANLETKPTNPPLKTNSDNAPTDPTLLPEPAPSTPVAPTPIPVGISEDGKSFVIGGNQPVAPTPIPVGLSPPASTTFFNGQDLTGWEGMEGYWSVENGAIVGRSPPGHPASQTFLCSQKSFGDFELRFRAKLVDGIGNSGVQFRSQISDRGEFRVVGPQCEIGLKGTFPPSSVVSEPSVRPAIPADRDRVTATYKINNYNDYVIRCEKNHIIIKLNGQIMVDDDFPSMPDTGIIAFQIHGRETPKEVDFKDIFLVEIAQSTEDAQFQPLFNGKDLTGWKTDPKQPGDWFVEDGILYGRSGPSNLFTTRGDFEDFHIRIEARINASGNSGIYFRCANGIREAENFPDAYKAAIRLTDRVDFRTGSLDGMVSVEAELIQSNTWFLMEVISEGNHISIKIDGQEVVNFTDMENRYSKGEFALTCIDGNTRVEFRKIEVKKLNRTTLIQELGQ